MIDWGMPIYFDVSGMQAHVEEVPQGNVELRRTMDGRVERILNRGKIYKVSSPSGNVFEYHADGTPVDHIYTISNYPPAQRKARERRDAKRGDVLLGDAIESSEIFGSF